MNGKRNMILIVLLAVALPAAASGQQVGTEGKADALVRAQLLADTAAVQPGQPLLLGVRLEIAPGWHVYWKNPGDAGVATQVELDLPPGFSAGPVRYPVPVRFEQPGEIVGYGYEGEVMLLVEVTPPGDLATDQPVPVKVRVSWLSCKEICVPGRSSLALKLPVGDRGEGAHKDLFDRWRQRLPVPADGPRSPASVEVAGGPVEGNKTGTFHVDVRWKTPPGDVLWFPAPDPAVAVEDVRVTTEGTRTRIRFAARVLTGQEPGSGILQSVVGYTDSRGNRRGISVPIHLRAADAADTRPSSGSQP